MVKTDVREVKEQLPPPHVLIQQEGPVSFIYYYVNLCHRRMMQNLTRL